MQAFLQSPLGEDPVVSKVRLKASPERVFQAWTDPDEVKSWFGHDPYSLEDAKIDLRVGGEWLFSFNASDTTYNAVGGSYLVIEANRRLVFTWRHEQTIDGVRVASAVSEVDVDIEPRGAGCDVTVTHRNIETLEGRRGVAGGWSRALESLSTTFTSSDRSKSA